MLPRCRRTHRPQQGCQRRPAPQPRHRWVGQRPDADVAGNAAPVPADGPCPRRWPDTAGCHANAATARLAVDRRPNNNGLVDNAAGTSIHSPSADSAATGGPVLEMVDRMCDSAGRPREVVLPGIPSRRRVPFFAGMTFCPGPQFLAPPYLKALPATNGSAPVAEFDPFPLGPHQGKFWHPASGKPTDTCRQSARPRKSLRKPAISGGPGRFGMGFRAGIALKPSISMGLRKVSGAGWKTTMSGGNDISY
jgi:hypothetical protein